MYKLIYFHKRYFHNSIQFDFMINGYEFLKYEFMTHFNFTHHIIFPKVFEKMKSI